MFTVVSMYITALVCLCVASARTATVEVETPQGPIVGERHDKYNTFFGVPYAQVDEENPFGNSIEYPHFNIPFIANDSSILCPQSIYQVSNELQCLRLNIYVPHIATNKTLPILVWFHGGGFIFGSAGEYGGEYLVKHGIIVISVNYRLGPYGFFCLNDRTVPGNQGMKDQIDALRWVKKNIGAFNGNPHEVTIAGESYGGGAVDLHLYSDYETLFQRAIVQSGSIFDEGFYVKPDRHAAVKIARYLGHEVNKTREALRLLASEVPSVVMAAALNLSLPLSVCKEKKFRGVQNFVTRDPFHLYKAERIEKTQIMIGYTSMELLYVYANQPQQFYDDQGDIFFKGLERNFDLRRNDLEFLSGVLHDFYLGEKLVGPGSVLELSAASSDFVVNHAAERSINKYMNVGTTVYKYLFSYTGGSPYKNITGSGASHTEELKYLFEWQTPIEGLEQKVIRDRMTTLWSNFVKFGNPTPEKTDLLPVRWIPLVGNTRPYMNIAENMSMESHLNHQRMAFWDMFWHIFKKNSAVYDP